MYTIPYRLWMSEISAIPHGSFGANVAKAIKWFISILYRDIDFLDTARRMISSHLRTFFSPYPTCDIESSILRWYWEDGRKMLRIVSIFCDFPVKMSRVTYKRFGRHCTASLLFQQQFFGDRKKVHIIRVRVCRLPHSTHRVYRNEWKHGENT